MGDKDERNIPADQGAPGSDTSRGINPVQHSERGQQPAEGKPQREDEREGDGTGARAGEYN